MKHLLCLSLLCALLAPLAAPAQTPADSLSRCLADNTSGRDRKDLARWVFFAMAAHPEMTKHASPDIADTKGGTDMQVAAMFMRLLTDSCAQQARQAYKEGGPRAIQTAFETLGQLAMMELMSNAQVNEAMGGFQKHIDQAKLGQVFDGR